MPLRIPWRPIVAPLASVWHPEAGVLDYTWWVFVCLKVCGSDIFDSDFSAPTSGTKKGDPNREELGHV
jgi:hypothetical protein